MKKELLFSVTKKDLKIEFYKASGPGGQHRNKRETACRITHRDSGAVGMCADHREQLKNKKEAFSRMTQDPKFMRWVNREAFLMMEGRVQVEKRIDREMEGKNLLVEGQQDGRWTPLESE